MEPISKPARHRGLVIEAGVFVALIGTFLAANYLYGRHVPSAANQMSPSPVATTLAGGSRATATVTPTPTASVTPAPVPFVVSELDVVFVLPGELSGLSAALVRQPAQSATGRTVGFSTAQLASRGCSAASGALGYLSDASSDTPGETVVGRTAQAIYYYRPATGGCDDASAAGTADVLRQALVSLKATTSP